MYVNREKRFQQEKQIHDLKSYVKQSMFEKEKNDWLGKNNNGLAFLRQKSENNRKASQMENLKRRRERLKELIINEEREFRNELGSLNKSEGQVRQEMKDRVEALRYVNDQERKAEVNRLLDMKFRNNADELRCIDQKANEVKTQIEREIQMIEKKKLLDRANEEDKLFNELNNLDVKEKILKQKRDWESYMQKIVERNNVLAEQLVEIQKRKADELREAEIENNAFRMDLEKSKINDLIKIERQKEESKKVAEEIRRFNDYQKNQKEAYSKREKFEDRIIIQKQIQRENELILLEEKQKERYKKETREFFQSVKNRNQEQKNIQALIDQLLLIETEQQWKKKEDIWRREEKARAKLLNEVEVHRSESQNDKNQQLNVLKNQKIFDRVEADAGLSLFEKEEKELLMREIKKKSSYQQEIMNQIMEKFERKQKELFIIMEEERKQKILELEYQQKLEYELKKGEQIIEDIRKLKNVFAS